MNLPDEIVDIIREYSKPLTRPDWKRLHKFPHSEFGIQLFIGVRSQNRLCTVTFDRACRVIQDRVVVRVPQFCTFHGSGCTTKSKTKRVCSLTCNTHDCISRVCSQACNTPVCMSCNKCLLHR
jgi:hypothetical protein